MVQGERRTQAQGLCVSQVPLATLPKSLSCSCVPTRGRQGVGHIHALHGLEPRLVDMRTTYVIVVYENVNNKCKMVSTGRGTLQLCYVLDICTIRLKKFDLVIFFFAEPDVYPDKPHDTPRYNVFTQRSRENSVRPRGKVTRLPLVSLTIH